MTEDDSERFDALLRAVAASPGVPMPGKSVMGGRFRLERRLGEGGFGVVYEAEDLRDGGRVALKLLRHPQADWLYRFKREFRSLQRLAHPCLVAQGELFSDGERWFFTMELVDGVDFAAHVRQGTAAPDGGGFDEAKLRGALGQLLGGLAALHAEDKVHRDIKPSNVLVSREGRVVLIDFGLATESFRTTDAAAVGTPAYMAPEQAVSSEVGPAADVYAVGAMLYEVLTGRTPFEGKPLQILVAKQSSQPPSPRSLAPAIPEDLDALCMRCLRFDPLERPTAADALRSLGAAASEPTASRASMDGGTFVGRGAELDALRAAFDASAKGQLTTVIVCGESGIGKSRLVRHFTARVLAEHPDAMILAGRCHEREAIPYKALDGIVDALSRRLSRMPASDVAALLPTRHALLARLFPVMLRVPALGKERAEADGEQGGATDLRQRAFLALRELFTRVALRHPTLVAVDDLQWADDDGMLALAEILRAPDAPPLLFVGTVRASRSSGDRTVERLRASIPGDVRLVDLTGLEKEEARALAAAHLSRAGGAAVDPRWIAAEAGGHPLFVEELVRRAVMGGPAEANLRLDDAIWKRIAELEPRTHEVAELVAVAGKPLPQQVAAAAARLEPGEFPRRVAVLRASNLVRTSGAAYVQPWADAIVIEPYHDRVSEAVLARLEPSRRRALHEALAVAFEASSHLDPEALALHWREAGSAARAAEYAVRAGDQAFRTFAFDRATSWFEQALDLLPESDAAARRGLRVKLGDALASAGRGALAASQFEIAAAEAPRLEALELRRRAAEHLLRSGHFDRGLESSRVVLAAIGMRIPKSRFQTLVAILFVSLLLRLRGFGFRERAQGEIPAEDLMRIDACRSIATGLSFVETFVGFIFMRRALLLALSAGDLERIIPLLGMEAGFNAVAGGRGWRRTERLTRLTHALAERSGSAQAKTYTMATTGLALYLNGRFREAADKIVETINALDSMGLVQEGVTARIFMIQTLAFLGSFRELRRLQTEGLREAVARGDVYAKVNLRIGLPNLAWLLEDRPDVAEREITSAMQEWSTRGFHNEHCYALLSRVSIALYVGDPEKAYALAEELIVRTRRSLFWRIQTIRLRVHYAHGISALAAADRPGADRSILLRRAAADARALERERMAWMQPFAKVLRAGVAVRESSPQEALAGLDAAAREFSACDMAAHAAATRHRLAMLRDDGAAASEMARAREVLTAEQVVAPERMMAILVPGVSGG
jgi:tRNA A-37 threonylcarbamoyl transferase component Bud32